MDVELHVASAFSFLYGASLPEDLAARAAELGLRAVHQPDQRRTVGVHRGRAIVLNHEGAGEGPRILINPYRRIPIDLLQVREASRIDLHFGHDVPNAQ